MSLLFLESNGMQMKPVTSFTRPRVVWWDWPHPRWALLPTIQTFLSGTYKHTIRKVAYLLHTNPTWIWPQGHRDPSLQMAKAPQALPDNLSKSSRVHEGPATTDRLTLTHQALSSRHKKTQSDYSRIPNASFILQGSFYYFTDSNEYVGSHME